MDLSGLSTDQLLQMKQQLSSGNQAPAAKTQVEPSNIPVKQTSDVKSPGSGVDLSGLSTEQLLEMKQKLSGTTSPQGNTGTSTNKVNAPVDLSGGLDAAINSGSPQSTPTAPNPNTGANLSVIGGLNGQNMAKTGAGRVMLATGAGVIQGANYVGQKAEQLGTDALVLSHAITPQQRAQYDAATAKVGTAVIPPDYIKQAEDAHPVLTTVGRVLGGSAAAGLVGAGAGAAAETLGSAAGLSNAAAATLGTASNFMLTGAGTADRGHRVAGAIGGLVAGGLFKLAGQKIAQMAYGAQTLPTLNKVADTVNAQLDGVSAKNTAISAALNDFNIKQAGINDLEQKFSTIPGQFESPNLKSVIKQAIEDHGELMTPTQKAVLQRTTAELSTPQPIKNIVDLKRRLNNNYSLFNDPQTPGEVKQAFNSILGQSKSAIGDALNKSGNSNIYQDFTDQYNKVLKPAQDIGLGDLSRMDPQSLEFAQKSKQIFNNAIAKGDPTKVTAMMQGMGMEARKAIGAHLINQALAKASDESGQIVNARGFVKSLNDLGGTYDAAFLPETKTMLDGVKKMALVSSRYGSAAGRGVAGVLENIPGGGLLKVPGHVISALLDSKGGQLFLKSVGGSLEGPNMAKRLLDQVGHQASQVGAAGGGFEASNITKKLMN